MADLTSNSNIPEGLSNRPLGILKPLGGLGLRLQRYVPLGARPLSVSRVGPMRISRAERFLPASTFESPDVSTLIQPPLMSEIGDRAAQPSPEAIQRQPEAAQPPLVGPDMPPPQTTIQRQSDQSSPPAAEPLKAGDIPPPSPKEAGIQRQTEPVPTPSAEPFRAGDILPPSPREVAIQRQMEASARPSISGQPAPEPSVSQADSSAAPPPVVDEPTLAVEGTDTVEPPVAPPEVQRWSKTNPSGPSPASPTLTSAPVSQASSDSTESGGQLTPQFEPLAPSADTSADTSAEDIPSVTGMDEPLLSRAVSDPMSTAEASDVAVEASGPDASVLQAQPDQETAASHQPSTPNSSPEALANPLQRDAAPLPRSASPDSSQTASSPAVVPAATAAETPAIQRVAPQTAEGLAAASQPSTSETPPVNGPEVAPPAGAATPNIQRREVPEPATAQGDDPTSVAPVSPIPPSSSSPEALVQANQAKGLDSSNVDSPERAERAAPAAEVLSAPPTSPEDNGTVQRTAPSAVSDTAPSGLLSEAPSPRIILEVTAGESPTVQRQATAEVTAEGSSRSPEPGLTDSSDRAPTGAPLAAEAASAKGDTESGNYGDEIAPQESTTVQRQVDTGIDITIPQTSARLDPVGDLQKSPFTEAPPATETDAEAGPASSPNTSVSNSEAPTLNPVAETFRASSAPPSSVNKPTADSPITVNDTPAINRAVETTDTPTTSTPIDLTPEVTPRGTVVEPANSDTSTISRAVETADVPTASTSEAASGTDIQTGDDDTSTSDRAAKAIDAPIALPPEAASPVADINTADDRSTLNRFTETAPITPPSETTQVADAFGDDSPTAETLETPRSAVQPVASVSPDLVQRRATPDAQGEAPITSQPIPTVEPFEEAVPVEAGTADPASPEISRAPADTPNASQNIDLPKLSTVLKPLSVIQPFRSPNARMTVTNPESLAMLPSASSEPPKTVPTISPPETSATASPNTPVIQRQPEKTAASVSSGGNSETTSDIDISEYPSMPSPDEVMTALSGLSSSQSPTVQRQPERKDTPPDKAAAEEQPISVGKSPQVQRKATAQAPPTQWSDVESLFTPKPQQAHGSPPAPPSASASSDSYSNLKPFETIQRKAAPASSDTIQPDEAATITTSPNEPAESTASPEALDQLVHQVYALICQRLAIERERYGLSRRR